jgi:hypothetical protein
MARSYHVDIVRHAADVDGKWLDNLLSRYSLPGVARGTQGVSRRLSADAIYHIALVARLTESLGVGVGDAVDLATRLLAAPDSGLPLTAVVHLRLQSDIFKSGIDSRIADGVESLSPPRRGRPPVSSAAVRRGG